MILPTQAFLLVPILLMLCVSAACMIWDNFTTLYYNNLGGLRFGIGKVQVIVIYPKYGISIPTENDYLVEEPDDSLHDDDDDDPESDHDMYDLTNKSIKLEYTAFTPGPRAIVHFEDQEIPAIIRVPMNKGRHVVIIPFSYFKDRILTSSKGIGIGGPLFVHHLELIDANSPADNLLPEESVLYTGFDHLSHDIQYSAAACLRHKESPPLRQFVEFVDYWDPEQDFIIINKNSLGFRRGGYGITKSAKGISIKYDGVLFQNLVNAFDRIDLSNTLLRLSVDQTSFPVNGSPDIDIKIQYHQDSVDDGAPLYSMYTLTVHDAPVNSYDIPFSAFPDIRYQDVKRIWIYGPITLHRIKLVPILAPGRFLSRMTDSDSPIVMEVDNLSTWPDSLDHSDMLITTPHSSSDEFNGFKHGLGLNSLNYPCYGSGVSLGDGGVELSNDGRVNEQLAPPNGIYDLSHALLEIEYSSKIDITRILRVHTVNPDDTGSNYHIQPIELDLLFTKGKRERITINLTKCGPSNSLSIIGHGVVTIHQISVQLLLPGQPQRAEVIDDFADWPLLPDSDPKTTDLALSTTGLVRDQCGQTSIDDESGHDDYGSGIYDYRQFRRNNMPVLLHNLTHIVGHGIYIPDGKRLIQPLHPGSLPSNLIITYSAAHSATRKIAFVFLNIFEHNAMIDYIYRHIVFNGGELHQVVVKVTLFTDRNDESLIATIIHGPLTVHQAQFVDTHFPDSIEMSPGQSTANALLIDDFSNWEIDPNNQFHELHSMNPDGFGTVTLHDFDEYLIEGFLGKWAHDKLSCLSLRITYTLQVDAVCKISLIRKPLNAMVGHDPYDTPTLHFIDMEFDAGVNVILEQYLGKLWDVSDYQYDNEYYGFIIYGPMRNHGRLNDPLIIHRIELIANPEYTEPIIPEYSIDQPSHGTGSLALASLIDATFHQRLWGFRMKLLLHRSNDQLPLKVERGHILRDTYHIVNMDPKDLMKETKVMFLNEDGNDARGLSREFFTLAAKEINNPKSTLFTVIPDANHALHINPDSIVQDDHLDQFKLIGRLIGMSILSNYLMGIRFVPSLYRKLIDMPTPIITELPNLLENNVPNPDISELEAFDQEKFQHFTWLLNTDISDMSEQLALFMCLSEPHLNEMKTVNLVKNGRNILVTQSNKHQYVQEYTNWYIIGKGEAQANALRDGVWDVIPRKYLALFNVAELELLIAGTSTIDVDDWERNTNYCNSFDTSNSYLPDEITIKHFWTCIRSWNADQHTKLLVYVTGSPQVPYGGFAALQPPFSIIRETSQDFIPRSYTCFNTLYLSPFTDADLLCKRLASSILHGTVFSSA